MEALIDDLNVRELRDNLAEHLSRVAAGASLVVTSRGRPVARLVPYVAAEARRFGFMEGQIAFLDEDDGMETDIAASIIAELDPPA
jgi:prevent-host-death family protein